MTFVFQDVAQYAIYMIASVFQNAYQNAVNAIVHHAFASQHIAAILVAVFVFALLASAILEEDAIHLADMFAIILAK